MPRQSLGRGCHQQAFSTALKGRSDLKLKRRLPISRQNQMFRFGSGILGAGWGSRDLRINCNSSEQWKGF
jgi:hypothetical protein